MKSLDKRNMTKTRSTTKRTPRTNPLLVSNTPKWEDWKEKKVNVGGDLELRPVTYYK